MFERIDIEYIPLITKLANNLDIHDFFFLENFIPKYFNNFHCEKKKNFSRYMLVFQL